MGSPVLSGMKANNDGSKTTPETRPMTWHKRFHENGSSGCPLCGRPLSPKDKPRYIHVGEGGLSILRADLPCTGGYSGECAVFADGTVDTGDMGWFEVGSTCARKLGPEWHKELPPLQPIATAP